MTQKIAGLVLGLLLVCGGAGPVQGARVASADSATLSTTTTRPESQGVKAAEALSTITGVAISPLFGVSAVGAYKYWKTDPSRRATLPWFAQPWFWVPGLLLIALVFLKDTTGTAMPIALKKPFDIAELFENKISALVAAGAFVPLIASVFGACGRGDDGMSASPMVMTGLAFIEPARWLNGLAVPLAIGVFLVVWMVAHVINVLILLSPLGAVDVVLKGARLLLLTTVAATALVNPYFGAAVAVVVIIVAWFLAGWSMRLLIFGNVFAWDLLTLRCKRCEVPVETGSRAFTARPVDKVPLRTCGKVRRDTQGRLVLDYHRWLILPKRTLVLPEGDYSVGRGLLNPEVLHLKDGIAKPLLTLPPRFVTHEAEFARVYGMAGVQDVGMLRGLKAFWNWLRGRLVTVGRKTVMAPV